MNVPESISRCRGDSEKVRFGSLTARFSLAVISGVICSGCASSGDVPGFAAPFVAINEAIHNERVATIGKDPGRDSSGFTHPVSERFGQMELRQLYERLNSTLFQAALTNYNCGHPVPQFTFSVTLYKASKALAGERRVEVIYAPALSPVGRTRGLLS